MSFEAIRATRVWYSAVILILALCLSPLAATSHTLPSPIQLSFGAGGGATPVIALDSKGGVDVAWVGSSIIFVRSTDGGMSFSAPKYVQSLSQPATNLQIALDRNDDVNLLWTVAGDVFFSRSTDRGLMFSTPLNLTTMAGVLPGSVQMVIEPGGSIDLFWVKGQGFATAIGMFTRSTDGGETFSPPSTVATMTAQSFSLGATIQSVTGPHGQLYIFMALRQQFANTDPCSVIFVRSLDHGATFSSPLSLSGQLTATSSCAAAVPTVDVEGNIDVLLTYKTSGPAGAQPPPQSVTFVRSTDKGASFSDPVTVSDTPQTFDVDNAQIVTTSPREVYVVWSGTGTTFFAHSRNFGKSFSEPRILSGSSSQSALAVDWCGVVNVAWADSTLDPDGRTSDIFLGRSGDEHRKFQNPVDLSLTANQSEISPRLVVNHRGDAYIVWQANEPNALPSQVLFRRVPASFSQPIDFRVKVLPESAETMPGGTLEFEVIGHDLDDVKGLNLTCAPLPSTLPHNNGIPSTMTCTFVPASLSAHGNRSSKLTVTVPSDFLTGKVFLGVAAIDGTTVSTETVEITVGSPF